MGTSDKLFDCAIQAEQELKKILATINRMLLASSSNKNLMEAKNTLEKELLVVHQSIFSKPKLANHEYPSLKR